jgi:hypothetical protein
VAVRILKVAFEPDIQDHVRELAAKANKCALTSEERAEDELMIEKSDLVAILKSLARQVLARQPRDNAQGSDVSIASFRNRPSP